MPEYETAPERQVDSFWIEASPAAPTARSITIRDGVDAFLHWSVIDVQGFCERRFDEYGIALPATIKRSVIKRQAEYFYGRLAAQHALAALGLHGLQVGTGDFREPLWPEDIIGSITHSHRHAAAIALERGRHAAIGIDLETVVAPEMRDTLLATAVSKAELDYLVSLDHHLGLEVLLTILFSAKESFFKAAFPGVGRYFDFDALALVAVDSVERTLRFEIREALSMELLPGTIRSVCYEMLDATTVCTCCSWASRA